MTRTAALPQLAALERLLEASLGARELAVVVGSSPHAEIDRQSVEGFVRSLGGANVRLSSSSVPYRNW